jgi:hypothetical protein
LGPSSCTDDDGDDDDLDDDTPTVVAVAVATATATVSPTVMAVVGVDELICAINNNQNEISKKTTI